MKKRSIKPTALDAVERKIINSVEKATAWGNAHAGRDREWTHRIKSDLVKLAHSLGFLAYASGADAADGGEWLFDTIWMKYIDDRLCRVPLILECEWKRSPNELSYDFEKLVVGRAEHKVLIFTLPNTAAKCLEPLGIVKPLLENASTFSLSCSGERYLFIWLQKIEARCRRYEVGHRAYRSE